MAVEMSGKYFIVSKWILFLRPFQEENFPQSKKEFMELFSEFETFTFQVIQTRFQNTFSALNFWTSVQNKDPKKCVVRSSVQLSVNSFSRKLYFVFFLFSRHGQETIPNPEFKEIFVFKVIAQKHLTIQSYSPNALDYSDCRIFETLIHEEMIRLRS